MIKSFTAMYTYCWFEKSTVECQLPVRCGEEFMEDKQLSLLWFSMILFRGQQKEQLISSLLVSGH